jgi:thioredoxin-dependent peroxiredoxin
MPRSDNAETDATHSSRVPEAGEMAPDFTLPNADGHPVHLADLRGTRVVLYFYPKDDTPGCTAEACGFRDSWQELREEGAEVYGISRDGAKSHQKFAKKAALPFPLLSDEDGTVARQYGVWVEKSMYGRKYMGVARTTFYVRPDGIIGHVWQQVKPDGHALKVLEYLRRV